MVRLKEQIRLWSKYYAPYVSYDQDDWDDLLPIVELAMNNAVSASTGQTPYFVNYGFHPRVPSSVIQPSPEVRSPLAIDFHERSLKVQTDVRKRIATAQDRQKKYADEKRQEVKFEVNDKVLLSTENLSVRRPTPKLTTPSSDLSRFSRSFRLSPID